MERRTFLTALGCVGTSLPLLTQTAPPGAGGRITLLHTNDTHSRIEPFGPGNGSLSGRGGMARRSTLVKQLRKELGPVLLLDAGDVFQGTPYFNLHKGRLDYRLMSMMGYDIGTLGNHDFDGGVEDLLAAMEFATFDFVNCNFEMKGAPLLQRRVRPYVLREFPGIRIGITGVGVDFKGLVAPRNHHGITWRDPAESLKPIVTRLREKEKVDLVVVLSHLGHPSRDRGLCDLQLPGLVPGIDVIIGGHSHTFLDEPVKVAQARGQTYINQVGFGGVSLGRLDFAMAKGEVRSFAGGALPV